VSYILIANANLQNLKVLTLVVKRYPKLEFLLTLLLSVSLVISFRFWSDLYTFHFWYSLFTYV